MTAFPDEKGGAVGFFFGVTSDGTPGGKTRVTVDGLSEPSPGACPG